MPATAPRSRLLRPLVSLSLALAAALGCASAPGPDPASAPPAASALAAAPPASASADPRLQNPWFASGRRAVAEAAPRVAGEPPARNVILFVGDGMGVSTVTAARILEGQLRGEPGEENLLAFERLPHVALAKTYSIDAQVPDSASTMTALVSGVKTLSATLGVDEGIVRGDHTSVAPSRVATILEEAEERGLATGVVSTATVTHATPAACYAHVPLRFWEDDSRLTEAARSAGFPDIARQLVELPHGDGLEVALGGGRAHFLPRSVADPEEPDRTGGRLDGRDLTAEWVEGRDGAVYVWSRAGFDAVDVEDTRHLLGLFEPGHMEWEADRAGDAAGEPSLAEMTALSIDLLSRDPDGFFLMVEAGRIDHGHHAGNAWRALVDTIALSDAVRVALEKTGAETLVVVTADHSHTLTISGYPERGNPILGLVTGPDWFGEGGERLSEDATGRPYTTLSYANGPGYTGASAEQPEGPHTMPHRPCDRGAGSCSTRGITKGRPDLRDVDTTDPDHLQEATVPLGSETHAGEDVPVYAGGRRAALFHGVREQSYVYHAMIEALGWTERGQPVAP